MFISGFSFNSASLAISLLLLVGGDAFAPDVLRNVLEFLSTQGNTPKISVHLSSPQNLDQKLSSVSRRWSDRPLVEVGPGVYKPDKLTFDKEKYKKEIKLLLEMKSEDQEDK